MIRNIVVVLLVCLTSKASAQGIKFEKDLSWQQLKSKARAENKFIFLDVMATWCGPCKAMDREVFTDANVGGFFNEKFISAKVQTDQTAEDNEAVKRWYDDARQIAQTYSVTVLPSFVILTPEGKLAAKVAGTRSAEELVAEAKEAMGPSNQYSALLEQYFAGKRDSSSVKRLLVIMENLGRNIMAEKLKSGGFLAKQGTGNPVKVPAGAVGNWTINYSLCDFGKQSIKSASKEISIALSANDLSITRSVADGQVKDELLLSGNLVSVPVKADGRNKNILLFNTEGCDLAQFSEITYADSTQEVEYTVTDKWKLSEADNRLTIDRLYHMNTGTVAMKLVYDRR